MGGDLEGKVVGKIIEKTHLKKKSVIVQIKFTG